MTGQFNALYEPAEVEMRDLAGRGRPDRRAQGRRGRPRRLPGLPRRPRLAAASEELTQPVDALLDERGVDFGDDYSRDALQAFSADDRLQCMPYGISPMVIYYNTDLVDFDRMEARGLDVPDEERLNWTFDQFAAAAEFATRPRRGTRGVYVEPTLRGAGAVHLLRRRPGVRRRDGPDVARVLRRHHADALERTLELLRSPTLTLSEEQLERAHARWSGSSAASSG